MARVERRARRLLGVVIVVLLGFVSGCSTGGSGTAREEQAVDVHDRPTVEAMLARYRSFQSDLLGQLDTTFGKQHWYAFTQLEPGVCGNDEPKNGQEFSLPAMTVDGSYPAQHWDQVRDLVIRVGKRHGFTRVTMLADRPGNLTFVGHDIENDGQYFFGLGKNAVLGIDTGCLLWGATPHPTP